MRGESGSGNSGYSYNSGSSSSYSSSGGTDYNAVRSYIDMGNLDAAATILNNAQNNFLKLIGKNNLLSLYYKTSR